MTSTAYRVLIALGLKGLAYEAVPVHLVPVPVDGPVTLTQSLPIIDYLHPLWCPAKPGAKTPPGC